MKIKEKLYYLIFISVLIELTGCSTAPPDNQENICDIYREYPDWYEDSLDMQDDWGTPMQVAMAIIKQESSFREDARPPKKYVLGFIPWGRVSSAYGYAQALDMTWDTYDDATDNGGSRDDFADAMQFIGWYTTSTQKTLGVSKWDAYGQYLAYHEGAGGYKRGTYRSKPWLMDVARKVDRQAKTYAWQLKQCRAELEDNRSWW